MVGCRNKRVDWDQAAVLRQRMRSKEKYFIGFRVGPQQLNQEQPQESSPQLRLAFLAPLKLACGQNQTRIK